MKKDAMDFYGEINALILTDIPRVPMIIYRHPDMTIYRTVNEKINREPPIKTKFRFV